MVTALTRLRELSVSRAELRALPQEVLQLPQLTVRQRAVFIALPHLKVSS